MSTFLARVGRFSARFRWVVIGAWALILALLIGVSALGSSAASSDSTSDALPDTPAGLALEHMQEEFPSAGADAASLQLVFAPPSEDVTDPAAVASIQDVLAEAAGLPGVTAVSDPFDASRPMISPSGRVAVATLSYGEIPDDQRQAFYDAALALQESVPADLGAELGGNLVPLGAPAPGPGEAVGIVLALIVLALTFGSLLAAGINLLVAIVGVGIGLIGVLAYGSIAPLGDNAIILASMLGLAVGIDYSLFVLSRYRIELRSGRSVDDAVARATGTAGTAVVFAGLTVIVALVALAVAGVAAITEMGIAAAFAVAVAVLLALTLLPALLRFAGTRTLSRRQRRRLADGVLLVEGASQRRGIMRGWSSFVVKRPVIALVGGLTLLVIAAIPVLSMKTAAHVPGGSDPSSTERRAYNLVVEEFGGIQSPLIVLVEGDDIAAHLPSIESDIAELSGAQRVQPAEVNPTGTMARIVVIPDDGPLADGTKDLVHTIRSDADAIAGVHLEVTGETAIGIDQDEQTMQALLRYIAVIVLISIALMVVLFRSLLIPLVATLGYLLSVGASFGASVAVFQWGWLDAIIPAPQGDPMMSILPLVLVGVLFGLAMDYQVFLVSRIQEMHHRGMGPREAIREGFARSGPVLVAAASIMIVVFAGFALSEFAVGASIAFGLLVGVAADAFIVRMVLMPAALSLLGRSAWWMPRWLDRVLPNVDVEGRALDAPEPPAAREPVLVG